MRTHDDNQHTREFIELLEERANQAKKEKTSLITAGASHEKPLLGPILASNNVSVIWLPPDPQEILRISCGGGKLIPVEGDYCVIRGDIDACIDQLRKSLEALSQFKDVYEKHKKA